MARRKPHNERLNGGVITGDDRAFLQNGQLQQAIGGWYKPEDADRLWKLGGRQLSHTTSPTPDTGTPKGVEFMQYDEGSKWILCMIDDDIYRGLASTNTLTSLDSGYTAATHFEAVHADNKYFIATGIANKVYEETGGSYNLRDAGLEAPGEDFEAAAITTAGESGLPGSASGSGWVNTAKVTTGSSDDDYASASLSAAGSSVLTCSGFSAPTGDDRSVRVKLRLAGALPHGVDLPDELDPDSGFTVDVKVEVSEDAGSNWSTIYNRRSKSFWQSSIVAQSTIENNGTTPIGDVQVRITLTYVSGTRQATLQVYNVAVALGGLDGDAFALEGDIAYAVSEAVLIEGYPERIGPPSTVKIVTTSDFTAHRGVQLTLPTVVNTDTTHFIIWRSYEGATTYEEMGRVGQIESDETVWVDDFTEFPEDTVPPIKLPVIGYTHGAGGRSATAFLPRDTPMPVVDFLVIFEGALLGGKNRALYQSIPGRYESVPELNFVDHFDFEGNDNLKNAAALGSSLCIGAEQHIVIIDTFPRWENGVLIAAPLRTLRGQPGLAAVKGMTAYSVHGESRVAWVALDGIYETDGYAAKRLTDTADWDSHVSVADLDSAVLEWSKDMKCLWFAYDPDGNGNSKFALIHMSGKHRGKITWDHPGKIADMTTGKILGGELIWSLHTGDGKTYYENSANTDADASQAYNGSDTTWPLIVKHRRIHGQGDEFNVWEGAIYHTDGGSGQTISVDAETGRDHGNSQTTTKSVSLNGQERTEFFLNRSGEWIELTLTHTGEASFGLGFVQLDMDGLGEAGDIQ